MTSSPTPVLPDSRALLSSIIAAEDAGEGWGAAYKSAKALLATPPASDVAVPAGEMFVQQVSRLTHSSDDGWTPPDDPDDSLSTLDSLIADARTLLGGVA